MRPLNSVSRPRVPVTRISSKRMVYYKWGFPLVWFGSLALVVVTAALEPRASADPMMFVVPIISAVWMHLEAGERCTAMPVLASLLSRAGVLYISLRHGPVPEGREMFEVSPAETVASAKASGLDAVLNVYRASTQMVDREAGVTWTHLAFVKV